jgi:hypothetical protein
MRCARALASSRSLAETVKHDRAHSGSRTIGLVTVSQSTTTAVASPTTFFVKSQMRSLSSLVTQISTWGIRKFPNRSSFRVTEVECRVSLDSIKCADGNVDAAFGTHERQGDLVSVGARLFNAEKY